MNVSSPTCFLINFILLFYGNNYRYFKSTLNNFAQADTPQLYVIDLDVKHKQSTEYTDYRYDKPNEVERFTAKEGFLINGIFKGNKFIAEAENDQYFYKVIIHPGPDGKKKLTTIFPHEPEPEDIPQPGEEAEVEHRLINLNVKVKRSSEYVKYTYDELRDIDRFTCRRGYLIAKVLKGDRVVTEASNNDYYDRVIIHPGPDGKKKLTVLYPGEQESPDIAPPIVTEEPEQVQLLELNIKIKETNEYYKYKYDQINDLERFTAKKGYVFAKIIKDTKVLIEVTDGNYFDRVLIYRDEEGKKQMTTLHPGEEELVVVNLRERKNTDEFTYKFVPETKRVKFTCNEGFLIYKIIKGSEFITQVEDNNYYDRAIIEKDPAGGKKLTLLYPNDPDVGDPEEPYPAYKIAKGLVPAETEIGVDLADKDLMKLPGITVTKQPTKDPVHIDLDIFKECDLYHVKKNSFQGITTITARPGFGFKEIRHAADTIWHFDRCRKSTDHPHKIIMKESRGEKHVAIVFDNDYFVFRRPNKHQPWQDLSDRRYDITKIKFYKGNPNNLESLMELERHDYTIGTKYITIEYKFNPGVECTEIRYDRNVMWRYVNRFPKSLHLNLRLNTFVLVFDIRTYVVLNVPGP